MLTNGAHLLDYNAADISWFHSREPSLFARCNCQFLCFTVWFIAFTALTIMYLINEAKGVHTQEYSQISWRQVEVSSNGDLGIAIANEMQLHFITEFDKKELLDKARSIQTANSFGTLPEAPKSLILDNFARLTNEQSAWINDVFCAGVKVNIEKKG